MRKNHLFYVVIFKLAIMGFFSSGYSDELFKPFITYFIRTFSNPYSHFLNLEVTNAFPYPPLMLYVLSIAYCPLVFLDIHSYFIENILFKIPLLACDIWITYLLLKIFPNRPRKVIFLWALSPILIYSTYLHSQLDVIPTALFLFSIRLLMQKKHFGASIAFGLAMSVKFHVVACLPLLFIYLYRNNRLREILYYLIIPITIYFGFCLPYLFTQGFSELVWNNKEQQNIFQVFVSISNFKILIAPVALLLIIFRFATYKKINNDLLFGYIGSLFAVFVLFIPPGPAWYLWFLPFILLYPVKNIHLNKFPIFLVTCLSLVYIIYFMFFHRTEVLQLQFLDYKFPTFFDDNYVNALYTLLWALLFVTIYANYRFSIRSNQIYRSKYLSFAIGISGDSGAGKSTILSDIKSIFGNKITHIEGDADHKWERGDENWLLYTHLDPKANYLHRQVEDIYRLKMGMSAQRSDYDHETGKFTPKAKVQTNDYIVMCGLHTFYLPKMRKAMDLKIYLDTDDNLRRFWKIRRDMSHRGYSLEKIVDQLDKRIDDARKFIYPQKEFADIIVNYFALTDLHLGDNTSEPEIGLQLTFDSNINIDPLIMELQKISAIYEWDYSMNMKRQSLSIQNILTSKQIQVIADNIIENIQEITDAPIRWTDGHRGVIQLFTLLIIAEYKKKEAFEINS